MSETSQHSSTNYTYDNNGNQIKKEAYRINSDGTKTASQTENFVYNGLNQLVDYSFSNGIASNDKSASYKYMANGYRLSRTVNYTNRFTGAVTEETKYLWDKDNIVSFMDSSNNVTKKHYRGYQLICDDADKYYMHDPHGNVIETYESGETTPFDRYYYNAYGTQDGFDDTDMIERNNEWGYCDQLYDAYTNDYYMRARYYSPSIGRFITEDPIRDGSNWYSYCYNNPIKFKDMNGLKPGDEFNTADEAAIDFANFANPSSIKWGVEYGTHIYSYEKTIIKTYTIPKTKIKVSYTVTETKYSYIQPFTSNAVSHVNMNTDYYISQIENNGWNYVGGAHTHPSAKAKLREQYPKYNFNAKGAKSGWENALKEMDMVSDADKAYAKEHKGKVFYLAAPSGKVMKYSYSIFGIYSCKIINSSAPREVY